MREHNGYQGAGSFVEGNLTPFPPWFFRLVSYRYGRGSILITTNKGIKDWPDVLAGDEVLATAILDRLLHNSYVLDIKGRSYRLRDLEHAVIHQQAPRA